MPKLRVKDLEQHLRKAHGDKFEDPWSVGFKLEKIGHGTFEEARYGLPRKRVPRPRFGNRPKYAPRPDKLVQWHAGRIRYLISHPEQMADPILVGPGPVIEDGWHRFFAHLWTDTPWINIK